MLKQTFYRGRFGYHKNCSLIHHLLQGETLDGLPVIVFPREASKVVEGKVYEFMAKPTRDAAYVIENGGIKTTYRVVHAIAPTPIDNSEADFVDQILHRTSGNSRRASIADGLTGDALSKLQALRARL